MKKATAMILIVLAGLAWTQAAIARTGNTSSDLPEGISDGDWRAISEQIGDHRHRAIACEYGYQAKNTGQQWVAEFTSEGFLVTPQSGGWTWGLALSAYGASGAEQPVSGVPKITAKGCRVEYVWNSDLTEWLINDDRGLEHGFTLKRRPAGPEGPLRVTLRVRGGLNPVENPGGQGVTFVNGQSAVLNYDGLKVFDAAGRTLPARLEVSAGGLAIITDDADAVYPLTIDPIVQQAYLKASNTETFDLFGYSVAISGDTAIVGAYAEDSNAVGVNGNQADNSANSAGAVYVFVRTGGVWSQQAYLKASNTEADDDFGRSVAIYGDTVIVGTTWEDSNAVGVDGNQADNSANYSGAAYVFTRVGGVWSQQAYLKASNTEGDDWFGASVAIYGDTAIIGAHGESGSSVGVNGNQTDNSAGDSGAAYVFVRVGGVWSQQAYLKASNTEAGDRFGFSVDISGDTAIVGAEGEDSNAVGVNGNQTDNSASGSGAAYVFTRVGDVWSQQAYLKASNTDDSDQFGREVAISGDTAVVGAYHEDSNAVGVDGNQADNSALSSGAAYVFARAGTVWSQQAYLKTSNTEANDYFGTSVAISGDTVIVGANREDSNAVGVGGNQADNSASDSGAAYVFARSGTVWTQQAYLKASNSETDDLFGLAVSISGDTAIVGAQFEASNAVGVDGNQADNSANNSGAAYVFEISVLDFGDLPQDYGLTLVGDDGARHETGTLWLGAAVDAEFDGAESADASGDGADEDGVVVNGDWMEAVNGGAVDVTVTGGAGFLSSWIDWNGDNDFLDTGEQILNMVAVAAGTQTISFDIPAGALPDLGANTRFARFRLNDTNAVDLAPTGLATNGEVEDYELAFTAIISEFDFSQANYEVNEDGTVDVTVTRGDTTGTASVDIQLAGDTATGGPTPLVYPEDFDNTDLIVNFTDTEGSQTVTIPINDDAVDEPDETVNLTLANPAGGVLGTLTTATLDILDNDTAGFDVNPNSVNTTEAGGAETVSVLLTSEPTGNVVIDVASSDTGEGTAAPASLTFTNVNWNEDQTLTVTGADDAIADGDQTYMIQLTVNAGTADPTYAALDPVDISATNADDDAPGFIIGTISGNTTEAGGTATFTVRLDSQPVGNVVINVTSSNTGEGTATPASLTFTDANWNEDQTVTVTGVDDAVADGDQIFTVELTLDTGGTTDTTGYAALDPDDVTVTNEDNDFPGFTVGAINGNTMEDGTRATFEVRLDCQPVGNVVINVTSSNTGEGTATPANLTFTDVNWNIDQIVTVTGVDDMVADGNQNYMILLTPNAGSTTDTTGYAALDPPDVPVTNMDNDSVAFDVGTVSGNTGEDGTRAMFAVRLGTEPNGIVVIAVSSSDPSEGEASPAGLTFGPGNWDTGQIVTVAGVDDKDADGDQNYTIRLVVDAEATTDTTGYAGSDPDDVRIVNLDDDEQKATFALSISITPEGSGSVAFGGETCDDSCSQTFDEGELVTLTAVPAEGFSFDHWENGAGGEESQTIVSMASDKSVIAVFGDTEPPFIISVNPEADAAGVDSDTKITVIFSEAMDPSTLTAVSFFVDGIEGTVEPAGDETAIFTPSEPLAGNTEYTATVTTAARDFAGNGMDSDYSWTFTTADSGPNAPPEAPQGVSPAHEAVVPSGTVILRASEFVDPDGDSHASSKWFVKRMDRVYGCPEYDASFEYVADSGDLTTHAIPVADGLKYVWRVEYTDHRGRTSGSSPEYAFKAGASGTGGPIIVDGGASKDDCRMVSFANWPDDPLSRMTVGHVVGDYNVLYHRVAGYDSASGKYVEYGPGLNIVPGKSYWICARDGVDFSYSGVPVSMNHDIEVRLSQGWNMIASPNGRGCSWGNVEVVGYDANGNYTINPVAVSNSGGAYVDTRLWRWENGDYESDTQFLVPGEGYWVRAISSGVWLRFPASAVASSSEIEKMRMTRNRTLELPPETGLAHADDGDRPPPPPNGFPDLTDPSGGGCFVDVAR